MALNRFVGALLAATAVVLAPAAAQAGSPPTLAFTPSTNGAYDYGTVVTGQMASQTFTLANSGGSGTSALTVALTGSPAFARTADTCSGTSLGPRKSCSITVRYAPTATASDTATLTATSKKPFGQASIRLTGHAAAARHIYWSQFTNSIGRADLNGQNVDQNFITVAGRPQGVAVDSGHIYWANFDGDAIGRADLSGANVDQAFIAGTSSPWGVAVDPGHIYWANEGTDTIGRADLAGQNVSQSFITPATGSSPSGMAVDSGHVYWAEQGADTIGRSDLDGQNVDDGFITGAARPFGVAADAG